MKRIAISQSNFLPWRGYFKLIDSVDEFVIFDTAQYTRRDWRNRNKIKTQDGLFWLSVPVQVKGNYHAKISDMKILENGWKEKHLKSLYGCYHNAPNFHVTFKLIEKIYSDHTNGSLSNLNETFIRKICQYLDITTNIIRDEELPSNDDRNERLLEWSKTRGASIYVSSPAAKSYLDVKKFLTGGVEVEWFDYGEAVKYQQRWGAFVPDLSIVDLLFNLGTKAKLYL